MPHPTGWDDQIFRPAAVRAKYKGSDIRAAVAVDGFNQSGGRGVTEDGPHALVSGMKELAVSLGGDEQHAPGLAGFDQSLR